MAKRDDDDDQLEAESTHFPRKPRPKVTIVTLALCFLNVLAALGFSFLLAMDYGKRQAWSYAVFKHDLTLMGLPLEEENGPSASRVTFPRPKLEAEHIKTAFSQRGGRASEPFQAVNLVIANPIFVQHLTPEILKDYFKDVGEPVKTLEDEVRRLKDALANDIAQAAQETAAAAKTETAKRKLLEKLLFSMVYTVQQVEGLDKKIKAVPAAKLGDLIKDAAQRRMLLDVLAPLDQNRPAELQDRLLEKAADFDSVPLERFTNLLKRRFDSAMAGKYDASLYFSKDWADLQRDTIDKRQAIAFLLFTVAQAQKPDGSPLYPGGPERVQAVIGLQEYAIAGQAMTRALLGIQERLVSAIKIDREGSVFQGKEKLESVGGFIAEYRDEVRRMQNLAAIIKDRQTRVADLQEQIKGHEKVYKDREEQVKEVTARLIKDRVETARQIKELQVLQEQFFQAKKKLRNAQQENIRLEQLIRKWEALKGAP